MHINQVRKIAKKMEINTYGMSKVVIIRTVQRWENNIPCFATERVETCNEYTCLWRDDCISASQGPQKG